MSDIPDSGSEPEEVEDESKVTPKQGISEAQNYIDELKAEIGRLRQDRGKDKADHDREIGEMRASIDTLQGYIDGVKKGMDKIRSRPNQTLVPPPPPPPETGDEVKNAPEKIDSGSARRRGWRRVW